MMPNAAQDTLDCNPKIFRTTCKCFVDSFHNFMRGEHPITSGCICLHTQRIAEKMWRVPHFHVVYTCFSSIFTQLIGHSVYTIVTATVKHCPQNVLLVPNNICTNCFFQPIYNLVMGTSTKLVWIIF